MDFTPGGSRYDGKKDIEISKKSRAADWLFITLFLVIILRLVLLPLLNWQWDWPGGQYRSAISGRLSDLFGLIDPHYMPSFIASTLSGWYVWMLHKNFLLKIDQGQWFNWLSIYFTIVMITLGMIMPHGWLLFASLAGLMIAIRLRTIKRKATRRWMKGRASPFARMGRNTILIMLFCVLVGLIQVWMFYYWPDRFDHDIVLFFVECGVVLFFAGFMIACIFNHATAYRGSIFRGFWDRYGFTSG